MNKRGQMYILAAVLLCAAIYGVMKVTNRLEAPSKTNFDFYVENFKGERAYVVDLGYLNKEISSDILTGSEGLLDVFTKFAWGSGVVYVKYDENDGWEVTNYFDKDIVICVDEDDDEKECEGISHGNRDLVDLSFNLNKRLSVMSTSSSGFSDGREAERSFSKNFNKEQSKIKIRINENDYEFEKPQKKMIESIIFQNVDENYLKVVRL